MKDGIQEQYFEDGSVRLKAKYIQGKLTGNFLVYYSNGRPMVKGRYENDKREGDWMYFNENGSVNQAISYSGGKVLNEEELTRQQQEFFRKIEKNIGKFREPVPADFFSGNRYDGNEY